MLTTVYKGLSKLQTSKVSQKNLIESSSETTSLSVAMAVISVLLPFLMLHNALAVENRSKYIIV